MVGDKGVDSYLKKEDILVFKDYKLLEEIGIVYYSSDSTFVYSAEESSQKVTYFDDEINLKFQKTTEGGEEIYIYVADNSILKT